MSEKLNTTVAVMGIDIGKNSFHVIGLDACARLRCDKSGRAARWKRGSPTCRRADRDGSLRRCTSSEP